MFFVADVRLIVFTLMAALVVGACTATRPVEQLPEHPVILVLYPESFTVDSEVKPDVDVERDRLYAENRSRTFQRSEAFSTDPDRSAILQYARFVDEDPSSNDLENRLGGRTWNFVFSALSFTLGDAMVHVDTTMRVRGRDAYEAARSVRAQYVITLPEVKLFRFGQERRCRVRMQVLHVPTRAVRLDTIVVANDAGYSTRMSLIRGGSWVSAVDAAAAMMAELPGPIIRRTLPRYVRRDSVMTARRNWFERNLWQQRVDPDIVAALSADTLQPRDVRHRWMLRSPDGSKAIVSSVSTFDGSAGLRFMQGAQEMVVYPQDQRDSTRLAFTIYVLEQVEGQWYWIRQQTTFRNHPEYDDDEHMRFTFEALRRIWYREYDGTPRDEFWERDMFRRIDGVPMLKHIRQQYE